MKVFLKVLLNMLMKLKMDFFYKREHENKINFFCNIKLKIQPRI